MGLSMLILVDGTGFYPLFSLYTLLIVLLISLWVQAKVWQDPVVPVSDSFRSYVAIENRKSEKL